MTFKPVEEQLPTPTQSDALVKLAMSLNLSHKEKLFAEAYIASKFNGTQASKIVGYGTQPRDIKKRLLKCVEYINALMQKQIDDLGYSKESVVRVLCDIAFFNATTLVCELTNEPIPITELTKTAQNAIKKVNTSSYVPKGEKELKTRVTSYVLHDKEKALELLGKHFGIFEKDNLQQGVQINQNISVIWN